MARRCCLAIALSFCCTMRRRLIDSLSCTLIFACLFSEVLQLGRNGLLRLLRRAPLRWWMAFAGQQVGVVVKRKLPGSYSGGETLLPHSNIWWWLSPALFRSY